MSELLLKDLSARLYYGVKCRSKRFKSRSLLWINDSRCVFKFRGEDGEDEYGELDIDEWNVRPYLRSMSSMTEDEMEELKEYSGLKYEQLDLASYQNGAYKCLDFYLSEVPSYVVILVFDWLNAHHFDYRGLISLGLALEATPEIYPSKIV